MAFKPKDIAKKYPVRVRSANDTIDLALVEIDAPLGNGLEASSADGLALMNHIAVAGFPNYRLGDSGVVVPGLVVGFRIVSAVRRILTNAAIVAGTSGGPAIDGLNRVVGVAVTGADRPENVGETENHGIVPIDALQYVSYVGQSQSHVAAPVRFTIS